MALALPAELWSHIYSFIGKPANAACVSRVHRQAAFRGLYIQLHELPVDPFIREIRKDLGKWQPKDPDGSIQRWLTARQRAITSIQVRQPRLPDEKWKSIQIDPFNPFHWQLQDIKRAADAIQQNREENFVAFFESQIREGAFDPPLNLPEHLPHPEKISMICSWLEIYGTNALFNREEASDFDFPPCELALKLNPDTISNRFRNACCQGDYEFLQAILTNSACLETLGSRGDLIEPFLDLCRKFPTIGMEILKSRNPALETHLAPEWLSIEESAISEGYFFLLNSSGNTKFSKTQVLERACYAGQSETVKKLLKNHDFSSANLGWSLFVTVEGPAVFLYLLPIPFVYSLCSHPLSYILVHGGFIGCNLVAYYKSFPLQRELLGSGLRLAGPAEYSLIMPIIAIAYLQMMSVGAMFGISMMTDSCKNDPCSTGAKAVLTIMGFGTAVIGGAMTTVTLGSLVLDGFPKRSFSVLGGFCSTIRDTAIGRLKVIRDLGSAILKKIPRFRASAKRHENPAFKKA